MNEDEITSDLDQKEGRTRGLADGGGRLIIGILGIVTISRHGGLLAGLALGLCEERDGDG